MMKLDRDLFAPKAEFTPTHFRLIHVNKNVDFLFSVFLFSFESIFVVDFPFFFHLDHGEDPWPPAEEVLTSETSTFGYVFDGNHHLFVLRLNYV